MLENFSTYLRSLTGDAEPAPYSQRAEQSLAPLDQLMPEDRAGLVTRQTAGTILGRRLLGTPDASVTATATRSTEAINAAGPSYDVIPGWTVPVSADLKDLGQAALGNAVVAEDTAGSLRPRSQQGTLAQSGPARALAVDETRPDGGRSAAGQVRAVRALRRADTIPVEGRKTAATHHRTKPNLTRPQNGSNARTKEVRPRPTQAQWREAQRLQQGALTSQDPAPVAGPARKLTPAQWRALGGKLMEAREAIKQTSIQAERQHGENADAHNAAVADTARKVDAALPGNTENATVNSARVAAAKYRKSIEAKATAGKDEAAANAFRDRYDTFTREAAHARGKAEQARLNGDIGEANRLDRAAADYAQAAQATVAEARTEGIDLKRTAGGGGGGRPVGVGRQAANASTGKKGESQIINTQYADSSESADGSSKTRKESGDPNVRRTIRQTASEAFAAERERHNRAFLRDHGVNPAALSDVLRKGAAALRAAKTPAQKRAARAWTMKSVKGLFERGRLERDRQLSRDENRDRPSTSYTNARYMAARRSLYSKLGRFIQGNEFGKEQDPVAVFNRQHTILLAGRASAEKAWAAYRKAHPRAAFPDRARAAVTIAAVTGALPNQFRKSFGDAAQSGDSEKALTAYAIVDRLIKNNPAALSALPPWLQRRLNAHHHLRREPTYTGKENREKLAREIETQAPHTRSLLGVAAKGPVDSVAQLLKLPLDIQASSDRRAREGLSAYYQRARAIAANDTLTREQKIGALNRLRHEAASKSRVGIDPLNWGSRVAYLGIFNMKLDAWINGSAAIIRAPRRSPTEDLNRWTGRQINRWLSLSEENRKSLAYVVGDLTGAKGAGKARRLVANVQRYSTRANRRWRSSAEFARKINITIGEKPAYASMDPFQARAWYLHTLTRLKSEANQYAKIVQRARFAHLARKTARSISRRAMRDRAIAWYFMMRYRNRTYRGQNRYNMRKYGLSKKEAIKLVPERAFRTNPHFNKRFGGEDGQQ